MLQALIIIASWPHKAHIQWTYSEWAQNIHESMLTGCPESAVMAEMCQLILEARRSVCNA